MEQPHRTAVSVAAKTQHNTLECQAQCDHIAIKIQFRSFESHALVQHLASWPEAAVVVDDDDDDVVAVNSKKKVDLAGSEKWKVHSGADMSESRVSELTSINQSLSALGVVLFLRRFSMGVLLVGSKPLSPTPILWSGANLHIPLAKWSSPPLPFSSPAELHQCSVATGTISHPLS